MEARAGVTPRFDSAGGNGRDAALERECGRAMEAPDQASGVTERMSANDGQTESSTEPEEIIDALRESDDVPALVAEYAELAYRNRRDVGAFSDVLRRAEEIAADRDADPVEIVAEIAEVSLIERARTAPEDLADLYHDRHRVQYTETVVEEGWMYPNTQSTVGFEDSGGEFVGLSPQDSDTYDCDCGGSFDDRASAKEHLREVSETARKARDGVLTPEEVLALG